MTHEIRIVNETELRSLVKLDLETIHIVEKAFLALAGGNVVMPPILSMAIEEANGEVDVKTAYIPGFDSFAIKISPGFFDNPKLGLPSLSGLMVLFSAKTGLIDALLMDNGYLTAVRTAAAGAIAAKYLANPDIETMGIMGSGDQARLQAYATHLVRPFNNVLVWARDEINGKQCAHDISQHLGVKADFTSDAEQLVAQSQLVVTTTPSTKPLLQSDWLHPGLHITAMGSDQGEKNEIDPTVFSRLDAYIPDRLSQCETLGELQCAIEAGIVKAPYHYPELGEVIANPEYKRSPQAITLCDLTGTGAQDTAIANFAFNAAIKAAKGMVFNA